MSKKIFRVEFDLKVKIRSEVEIDVDGLDRLAKLRVAGDAGKTAFNEIAYSDDVDESIAFEIADGIEIVIDPHEPTGLTYIKEVRKPAPTGLAKLSIPVEDREHSRLEALRQRLEELQPISTKNPIFRAFWVNASASVTMAARHKKWYDDESIAEIERSVDFLERKLNTISGDQATEDPEQSRIKAIRDRLEVLSGSVDPAVRTSAQLTNWWADCYGDLLRIETEEFVGTTYNIERLEKRVDEFEKTVEKRRERVEQATEDRDQEIGSAGSIPAEDRGKCVEHRLTAASERLQDLHDKCMTIGDSDLSRKWVDCSGALDWIRVNKRRGVDLEELLAVEQAIDSIEDRDQKIGSGVCPKCAGSKKVDSKTHLADEKGQRPCTSCQEYVYPGRWVDKA